MVVLVASVRVVEMPQRNDLSWRIQSHYEVCRVAEAEVVGNSQPCLNYWSVELALKTCLQLVSKGSQQFNQYKLNLQYANNLLISRVYKLLVHGSSSQLLSTDVIFKFIYTQQTVQFFSHLQAVIPNKIQCSLGCSISINSLKGWNSKDACEVSFLHRS